MVFQYYVIMTIYFEGNHFGNDISSGWGEGGNTDVQISFINSLSTDVMVSEPSLRNSSII